MKRSSTLMHIIPFFVVVLALVPLAVPYLQAGYQFADDRFAPYLRVEALRSALAGGQFPPRWFPDFDGGYGSPYPSFYAMLFYEVAVAFNALGLGVGAAVELTAFLAILAAALGMFVLARGLWGDEAGVLAAVLYTYAPYHLVDAFIRGALSEMAAFVFFPLVVHTTYRAILTRRRAWILLSGLAIAGLILTHNLMPIVFLPAVIALLSLVVALNGRRGGPRWIGLIRIAAAGTTGLLLSAYFWLPIAFERNLLRLDYFLQYDFHGDFVGRRTLFAWASAEPPFTSIGLILLMAAILGALVALWPRSNSSHGPIAVLALAAALSFLFMTTGRSVWIWERIPLLSFVQFPWRLLAPASFFLALAAGALPRAFRNRLVRWMAVVILGVAAYLQSKPLIRIEDRIGRATIEAMPICQEVWGTQDYRPASSRTLFWRGPTPPSDPSGALVLQPCRGSLDVLPEGKAEILSTARQGLRWEIRYSTEQAAVATIPQFYFPGWSAWVDGVPVPIDPSPGNGLLQVGLPAGVHSLEIDYRNTFVRSAGNLLSLLAVAALVAIAWSGRASLRRSVGDPG